MTKSVNRFLALTMTLVTALCVFFAVPSDAKTVRGTYPTRKGTILVTSDFYKGLIPTGHAAMVISRYNVVESVSSGVVWGSNNWTSRKKEIYGVTVKSTTAAQDAKAADYCIRQVGKKYNFNYLNTWTRSRFYCSQLVWAAFYDLYRINLNTTLFGNAVHPMELVYSSRTSTIYYYHK